MKQQIRRKNGSVALCATYSGLTVAYFFMTACDVSRDNGEQAVFSICLMGVCGIMAGVYGIRVQNLSRKIKDMKNKAR
ncbi:MAG: hypothetical protein NC311_05970 [Muribaculaceae bacterium]|nr:hypothetical protein [Muribaculaceae bacterium]